MTARATTSPTPIRPPRLAPGDVVRMVTMSGTFPKPTWQTARFFADALGLKLEFGKSMSRDPGYLGRDPRARADDFNDAVRDDRVRAILHFRGGNSAAETLPYLDFAALRRNPKVIAGFSDHSSIVMAARAAANLVTFLVPPTINAVPARRDLTIDSFRRVAFDGEAWIAMPAGGAEAWRKGTARGRLVGANLRVLSYLMATPFRPPLDGAILAWEEIGESLEDVNMMLASMRNAGVLGTIAGMVVGHLEGMKPKENGITGKGLVLEKFAKGPVLKTKAFGHFRPCFTLPLGVTAALDAGSGTLVLEESAVD